MSQQPINLRPDLAQLRDEGYVIEVRVGYLLVHDIPYVNPDRSILRGSLICALSDDIICPPADHVALWAGEHPCHHDGSKLSKIENSTHVGTVLVTTPPLLADHTFSAKPKRGGVDNYTDFYDKVTSYIAIIGGPAEHLDPTVTARTRRIIESSDDSVFKYSDTASARTHIVALSEKLKLSKIAIVGLGGTGSYVLDLVAKTPVQEIHLFDGDVFLQHNAFRAPGAASLDTLRTQPTKVAYLAGIYENMRRGIVPNDVYITEDNVEALRGMDFVFICVDRGDARKLLVEKLREFGIGFIDVGMGVYRTQDRLAGIVRTTTNVPDKTDHLEKYLSFGDGDPNADYTQAIQIADLNALNATFAVIRWKKIYGFYLDLEHEHQSAYTIDGNTIANDECK